MPEKKPIHIHPTTPDQEDRFARFELINWWEQKKLKNAKILVIGAGALGNEILKNLALMGIGNIFIADLDIIENSNLSRSILFREKDNGRKKAEVAAEAIQNIYPEIKVQWFHGNIIYDLGLGVFHWADVVIAGLDNREARLAINRNCWKTNTPWIDGAIEQLNGVARVFIPPHGTCYECTMGQKDWQILNARRACNLLTRDEMLMGKIPTTPTSASIIAAIQCQEAIKLLHGLDVLQSKGFIFNGLTHDSYTIDYPRKEECFSHETFHSIRSTQFSARHTLQEVLNLVKQELGNDAIIEFNREILFKLECSLCNQTETILTSLGKVPEKKGLCPTCGNMRNIDILHNINGSEPFLNMTFEKIGIPLYDIITGRDDMNQIFLEFSKDAPEVLGPLENPTPPDSSSTGQNPSPVT